MLATLKALLTRPLDFLNYKKLEAEKDAWQRAWQAQFNENVFVRQTNYDLMLEIEHLKNSGKDYSNETWFLARSGYTGEY